MSKRRSYADEQRLGPQPETQEQARERDRQIQEIIDAAKQKLDELASSREEFRYGDYGTIHHTGHIDVCTDEEGRVTQVWFRCMPLPFKQSFDSSREVLNSEGKIKAIILERKP